MKTIDIVVPCYNEQEVIAAYYEETSKHVAAINNYSFRYIFVNDGSRDNTLLLLKDLPQTMMMYGTSLFRVILVRKPPCLRD